MGMGAASTESSADMLECGDEDLGGGVSLFWMHLGGTVREVVAM
jgi:hypothetical protein